MKNFILFFSLFFLSFASLCNANTIALTPTEQQWITTHKIIKMGIDPGYRPYSFLDKQQAKPQGIVIDYLSIIERKLGIRFQIISNLTWTGLIDAIKSHKIDAIATVKKLPDRERFLNFTQAYLSTPLVVMTRKETPILKSIQKLSRLHLCLVKGYSSSQQILSTFPTLKPNYVTTPLEGLRAVASGKSDAYIGVLGVNSFIALQNGIGNLKVNVAMDMKKNAQSFGVRKDWPLLAKLIDKVLDSIPEEEKNRILQRWMPTQFGEVKRLGNQDLMSAIFPWLISIILAGLVGYLLIFLWNYQLKKELKWRRSELEKAEKIAHFGDWSFDFKNNIMTWSDELFHRVGRIPSEANQLTWTTLCSWLDPENIEKNQQFIEMLNNAKQGDIFPTLIAHFIKPNGDSSWLEVFGTAEYDTNGKPIFFYGIALDITEKKIAQDEMLEQEKIMLAQSRQAAMGR